MPVESMIEDGDLIPIDVKYPNFVINGNAVTLGERTYTFDNQGSVVSILTDKDLHSVLVYDNQHKIEGAGGPKNVSIPSVGDIIDALKSLLNDMITGVKNFFSEQFASILAKFNSIVEYYHELKQNIQNTISDIISYITSLYTDAKNKVISAYQFAVGGIKYIFNALKFHVKWLWKYAVEKTHQGISAAKRYAKKTTEYFHYALYGFIIFIILGVILLCIFRFVPIDLRIKYLPSGLV